MRFVGGLDARYDRRCQVQMQLQMSGAGTVQNRRESSRPPPEKYGHGALAVIEIEVWPGSGGASDGLWGCSSAALDRAG
jgi:hypothetical protein